MDNCERCGKSLGLFQGLFSDYCDTCKPIIEQERKAERARLEKEKSDEQQRRLEKSREYTTSLARYKAQSIRNRIDKGECLFFYQSVYLPVDSLVVQEVVASEFSIALLQSLGLDGWEIVGIVPKTVGVGLTNTSVGSSMGKSWGAGVGGNVVGVYVLLKKEISSRYKVSDTFLEEYIKENLSGFVTQSEEISLSDILSGKITVIPAIGSDESVGQQGNAEPELRVCPKCNVPMPVKIASGGDKRGKKFYVCPNYKQCKQVYPIEE